jgi:hypothetical protein
MNLQGRNLSIQLQGDDVTLLQTELRQLAFVINDTDAYFGGSTRDAVLEFQRTHDIQPTGIVDAETAHRINAEVDALANNNGQFVVRGRVRQANGDSLAGVELHAFDKDLRHEERLGVSAVDQEGNYEITYTADQFRRAEKKAADLIVRVFGQDQTQLAASTVRFNAAPVETVDLSIGDDQDKGASEYDQLVEELAPVLDGVPFTELTEEDVTFLVGETEQDAQRIRYLIAASQLATQTGLPAEAFYGFSRQNLPAELPGLLSQHPQLQRLALLTAIRENIIPSRFGDRVDGILERLQQLRVQRALQSSGDIPSASLGDLLSTCLPSDELQQEFARLYLQHEGSLDDFWPTLRQSPNFGDDTKVDSLQFAFGLASFTQNHLSMVQVLQQSRSGDARTSLRNLAKRDVADWIGLINQVIGQDVSAFPPDIEGDNAAEKAAQYAEAIAGAVASAFPTAVIAHRIEADEVPHKVDLLRFFAGNPDFELASIPIQRYLARNPETALAGVVDKEGLTRQLQSMERVFKLTPDYAEMRVLLEDGVDSAHRIVGMGQELFVAEYSGKLNGEKVALDMYNDAADIATTAFALYMKFGTAMDPVCPSAIPRVLESPEITSEFPEWKTLFGALELCACEHCRSVLSPAAYLVDVLHFLARCGKGPTGETPLQMLLKRRGDIQDIKLSCVNTNTPLPYIDLVNELLENAIFPYGGAGVWQTRSTAEELRAYPEAEHFNPKTYNFLANDVVYPWNLPFDLWLEQVRLYLNHTGVQLYQVMEIYLGKTVASDPDLAGPADTAIAAEYLHLSPKEWVLIARRDLKTTSMYWGFDVDPAAPDAWIGDLKCVSTFLDRSGLSYAELLELLHTDFIDPSPHSLEILPKQECDPDKMTIDGLDQVALEKTHRLVRLSRKLGWRLRDLDKAITAFNPGLPGDVNLTEVFLVQLSHVARLHADLGVPVVDLLAWWAPIDRRTYDTAGIPVTLSLYEQLFENRALINPVDSAFDLDGPFWTSPFPSIEKHLPALQAALGLSADDLMLLTDTGIAKTKLQLSRSEISPGDSGADTASHLFRIASLSKALGLSIPDFLSLKALVRMEPSTDPSLDVKLEPFRDTGSTQRFVETARYVAASPFSIEQLDYLLRDALRPSSSIAPTEGKMRALFGDLRTALDAIETDTTLVPDPTHALMKRMMAKIIPSASIEDAIALIADTKPLDDATLKERAKFIKVNFQSFLNPDEAQTKLLITTPAIAGSLTEVDARFAYVLSPLLLYVRQVLSEQEVITQLAEALNLEAETARALLSDLVEPPIVPPPKAIDVFLPGKFGFIHQARLYRMLHKIAMLVNGWGISTDELSWIFLHGSARGWLNFNLLPLAVADKPPPGASLVAWKRLAVVYDLFSWNRSLRKDTSAGADSHQVPFFNLLLDEADKVDASPSALRSTLETLTGWRLTDDVTAAVAEVLPLTLRASFQNERGLFPLKAALEMAERLDLSPTQLRKLCVVTNLKDEAGNLMQAVRSGFDNGKPLSVIRPVSDALREKQRAALVSYLVSHKKFRDSGELFAELLIDVEMSACQLTSRIKQAMSAAQLFVQRSLMGLEKGVSISRPNARKWEWMQNYRVWEANRKVFLWPENWYEPQLRDDKTDFFKDLENELLQDEITAENVESAFLTYLTQLDDVARPEICAMYHQQEPATLADDAVDLLHVFARTRGIPHTYYYRRRDHQQWTAWEKVDLDIEGDHLLPVVFERRLRLFWPVFAEKTDQKLSSTGEKQNYKNWEIKLAYSVHGHLGWTPKTVTNSVRLRAVEWENEKDESYIGKNGFLFRTYSDAENIYIKAFGHPPNWEPWRQFKAVEFRINACRGTTAANVSPLSYEFIETPTRSDFSYQKLAEKESEPDDELYLPELAGNVPVLSATPGQFQLLTRHQDRQFDPTKPFFFEDSNRTFLVNSVTLSEAVPFDGKDISFYVHWRYVFDVFYHPYTCTFIKQLNRYGIDGLLRPDPKKGEALLSRQQIKDDAFFENEYHPKLVLKPFPEDDVDFCSDGAYSQYNWELFFHIPLMLADQLSKNQRFEEAHRWFHYFFDPTDVETKIPVPYRYWKIRPFYENHDVTHTIAWLMQILEYKGGDEKLLKAKKEFSNEIAQWAKNPFNPHLIARLRISALQKAVVMKYVDNLLAWGDDLFRRETIEAINEATQLYILAAAVLGARPKEIPTRNTEEQSFRELAPHLDDFSNAPGVLIESFLPAPSKLEPTSTSKKGGKTIEKHSPFASPGTIETVLDIGRMLYFCIPRNDVLLRYWDTVADRLFKIRHCMNIEGVFRQLPLFEPPIDPALLVRATAAGLDLSSVLSELNAPLPAHRFNVTVRSALEFCSDVQSLGSALLSAMEKRDAEALAVLRMGHEVRLLEATTLIKIKQVDDSVSAEAALQKAREMADTRYQYYSNLAFMNEGEISHLVFLGASELLQTSSAYLQSLSAILHAIPQTTGGTTGVTITFGGVHIGMALDSAASALGAWSSVANIAATASATMGSYQRRRDEWNHQADLATKETKQIDQQIVGAQIRVAIAEQEVKNHALQTRQAKEVDQQMRSKFTNRELYTWMVSQLSKLYFQSYRLAFDLAKRAEMCFTYELGKPDSDRKFIVPDHWDSMKKGLLAGEKLRFDLKRMEAAYLEQNRREYEITKNISLATLDPYALLQLKQNGTCLVNLDEFLFDSDYPGHYLRRIKSVSLSIPCVAGPYTSVNCTLTLLKNSVRMTADPKDTEAFRDNVAAMQSIATSTGQNDSGMFELLFRDERYLPFEGAGAISKWQIELPEDCNRFDLDTISDLVIQLRYTSRDGGALLQESAKTRVLDKLKDEPAARLFSTKLEFPNEWYRFLHPDDTALKQTLALNLKNDRFPFQYRGMKLAVNTVTLFLKLKEGSGYDDATPLYFDMKLGSQLVDQRAFKVDKTILLPKFEFPGLDDTISDGKGAAERLLLEVNERVTLKETTKEVGIEKLPSSLRTTVKVGGVEHFRLNPDAFEDLWILYHFKASA